MDTLYYSILDRNVDIPVVKGMPPIVGSVVFYLVCVVLTGLLLYGLVQFIKSYAPRDISKGAVYERFTDAVDYESRINAIRVLRADLEGAIDVLAESSDTLCNIHDQVQDTYIGNNSAPTDESELSMPKEQQDRLTEKRKIRAKKRFEEEKKLYAASKNMPPVYECFADGGDAETLSLEIEELEALLEQPEIKKYIKEAEGMETLLAFNSKFLNKAMDSIVEGYFDATEDLLQRADRLIDTGNKVKARILDFRTKVETQKLASKSINKEVESVKSGDVSQETINNALNVTVEGFFSTSV